MKNKTNQLTQLADNKAPQHISIAGNIGSGKTTLTALLAKHMKFEPLYEEVDDNPYLFDFYNNMQRWSFNLQVYFLNKRLNQILEIREGNKNVIQDRTIYEDAHIFAQNLHTMGLMSSRDFDNYFSLFKLMSSLIQPPDLVIYLRASVAKLVAQIQKRGREYENSIRIDYLNGLNQQYEEWVANYKESKLLILNIDEYDFENQPEDLSYVIDRINGELNGLFP